jgi:hypothetical protein
MIDISLNDQLERVERDVKRSIEQARHRYAERIARLPEMAVQLLKDEAALGGIPGFPTTMEGPVIFGRIACPACDDPNAIVLLVLSRLGDASRAERRAAYAGYGCSLCTLPLSTIEQMDATGIDVMDVKMPDLPLPVIEVQLNDWMAKIEAEAAAQAQQSPPGGS